MSSAPSFLRSTFVLGVLTLMVGSSWAQPQDELTLGTLDFPTSASGEAQTEFLTGVLALHSFWYEEARDHFRRARAIDPQFAMGYWGEAMTHDHPIWEQHEGAEGRAVLEELDEREGLRWTDRERAYVHAVRTLFEGDGDIAERRRAYADEMLALAQRYPTDVEARVFSALAQMSVPSFDFDSADDVVPVAAELEAVYKEHPQHPGAIHYLIHVYDSDTFAPLGLRPANDYAATAPASSHAIHMPSHIYKELGMWERMAASNEHAYQTSVDWQERTDRPLRLRDYHSFRWMFDAYIELGRYDDAEALIDELERLEAEARRRDEEPGRITSTRDDLRRAFDEAVGHGSR